MPMDPPAVLALCHEHAQAEAEFDTDRILATLVPVPRYEFFPVAKLATGRDVVERFYRDQYPEFVTRVTGYELLDEWSNEHAAIQEYVIKVGDADDRSSGFRVLSMMPVDEDTGLLAGERLYCDEGFVRTLLGPFFDLLLPIAGP
jgi:hypothetical protein